LLSSKKQKTKKKKKIKGGGGEEREQKKEQRKKKQRGDKVGLKGFFRCSDGSSPNEKREQNSWLGSDQP